MHPARPLSERKTCVEAVTLERITQSMHKNALEFSAPNMHHEAYPNRCVKNCCVKTRTKVIINGALFKDFWEIFHNGTKTEQVLFKETHIGFPSRHFLVHVHGLLFTNESHSKSKQWGCNMKSGNKCIPLSVKFLLGNGWGREDYNGGRSNDVEKMAARLTGDQMEDELKRQLCPVLPGLRWTTLNNTSSGLLNLKLHFWKTTKLMTWLV